MAKLRKRVRKQKRKKWVSKRRKARWFTLKLSSVAHNKPQKSPEHIDMADMVLPSDFEHWPELELIKNRLRGEMDEEGARLKAQDLLLHLWRQLTCLAPLDRQVGVITERRMPAFQHFDLLTASELVTPIPEGGWFCWRFAQLNEHLGPEKMNMNVIGRRRQGYFGVVKAASEFAWQFSSKVDNTVWKDGAGNPMPDEEKKQVIVAIMSFDSALNGGEKSKRQANEYTRKLVWETHAILQRHDAQLIQKMCLAVLTVENPLLPRTTEMLVTQFDQIIAQHQDVRHKMATIIL